MTTHLLGRYNRPVALLAGLALVAGMLAVAPAPLRAADPQPEYTAAFDACPQGSVSTAGFTDVPAGHANAADIDCIAYYGITRGTGPTTYGPDLPVIREHMALFLKRMAELVGIEMPDAGSTPFTDIGQLTQDSQDAISQIYELEITRGTSTTTYSPSQNVTRGQMALFLTRLMDEMDPVFGGRDDYGFTPRDVPRRAQSPYQDLGSVPNTVYDAVTQLYQMGVGSGLGGSSANYGPNDDMTRAAMAEFMAAILDHSNLRPAGLVAQVSPTKGEGEFRISAMISVRNSNFQPVEERVVDWFYTADANGGLQQGGTCNTAAILGNGNCIWNDDDDATDEDGNIFRSFDSVEGSDMTLYAWVGTREDQEFDEDTANYSQATARSIKEPDDLLVTHNIPEHAAQIDGDTYIVDMDRRDPVTFTIQLLDDTGRLVETAGLEISIEVESRDITVAAARVSRGRPDPDYTTSGQRSTTETTLTTNEEGQAVFELDGPSQDDRLDTVTIDANCCDDQEFELAWSDGPSVLVSAQPTSRLYHYRSSEASVEFTIAYQLYDQYGDEITSDRRTNRSDDVDATLTSQLHSGDKGGSRFRFTPAASKDLNEGIRRGVISATVEETNLQANQEYFVLITPDISTGTGNNKISYADPVIVWVVADAESQSDFEPLEDSDLSTAGIAISGAEYAEVDLYPEDDKFRTFFTMWRYTPSDWLHIGSDRVGAEKFEQVWEQRVDDVDDLEIPLYPTVRFIRIK